MIRSKYKVRHRLLWYQSSLAVALALIFFTNLEVYLAQAELIPVEPLHWIFLFITASISLFILFPLKITLPKGLLMWCSGYFLISLIYFWGFLTFSVSPSDAFQEIRDRTLSVIFIFVSLVIFFNNVAVQTRCRYAIAIAGLVAAFNNVYELFNPLVFNELNLTGRPAGFYVDPNMSGAALILSLLLGISVLPPKYRTPFAAIIGLGVFLTFSRASLLGWLIVMALLVITGVIAYRSLFGWSIAFLIIVAGLTAGNFIDSAQFQEMSFLNENVLERLSQSSGEAVVDDSTLARLEVARQAWRMIMSHPLIGNGISSTKWLDVGGLVEHKISTHNLYLSFMADHGVLGILILPLLVGVVTYPTQRGMQSISFAFAAFILMWGCFSHNILEQRFFLLAFALMATLNQPLYSPRSKP